jgi:hypothetical protein
MAFTCLAAALAFRKPRPESWRGPSRPGSPVMADSRQQALGHDSPDDLRGSAPDTATASGGSGARQGARRPGWRSLGTAVRRDAVVRLAAHIAIWVPFVYALVRSLERGWVALSDAAIIALRSWDVLTAHGPLVGQATRLGQGAFDLGPLEYWLLTVPVHLDPRHGSLWGAALWCMLAGSLAIEAAWSVAGMLGGLAASGIILGVIAWYPQIAVGPSWNPSLGAMFFLAALATAWAVMSGKRGWWPVLVVSASIAAQAHLMFALASVSIVVLAGIIALIDSIRSGAGYRGYRWAVIGVIAAAACWAAPLIQQFTTRPGNMTVLVSNQGERGPGAGLTFGLRALAGATEPPAYWWKPLDSLGYLGLVWRRSAGFGIFSVVLVAVVLIIALWLFRSRRTATLAALTLLLSVAGVVTFARIPAVDIAATTSTVTSLTYLMIPLFPAGVLTWLIVATTLVLTGKQLLSQARQRAAAPGGAPSRAPGTAMGPLTARTTALAAVLVLAMAAWTAAQTDHWPGPARHVPVQAAAALKAVGFASGQIERAVPSQPIALAVKSSVPSYRRQLTFGIAYALRAAGYLPEIRPGLGVQLGPRYVYRGKPMPLVTVFARSGFSADVAKRPVTVRIRKPVRSRT